MTVKSQTFAFSVGEVSPAFYGRLDLQKYPLGLETCENFFVDYHGGLVNRAGTEFIAMLPEQPHKFSRFRTKTSDLGLFFTVNKMRVLKNGKFVHTAANVAGTIAAGLVTAANTLAIGQLVWVESAVVKGYFEVTTQAAGNFSIVSPIGQVVPDGAVQWAPVYELTTTFSAADLAAMKVRQDLKVAVITVDTRLPVFITRVTDSNWTLSNFSNTLPAAPVGLVGTPSAAGAASVGFAVTAVVDGVESAASAVLVTNSIVNYATTTGHFTLTWTAVSGAERYNVYRTLVFPAAYAAGAQLAYVGYTTGTTFVDRNITGDGTKGPPVPVDFFAGSNFPAVYARFQQRGVYAGLANDPLTIVGSIGQDKGKFSITFPPVATDSYNYTLDSESERPIKHMLSLRYGLMLFTDDGITQLRGGEGIAISATSALAEPQGYVSVGDLDPVAINLDVLFMTKLASELNQMVYTEYTNSFKMQDILVLASHMFGVDNQPVAVSWAAEPYKLLYFIREDGQRVTLTYERNLEVYGWSRYKTKGEYLDLEVLAENGYNLAYQTVRRRIRGFDVMFLERETPRRDDCYSRMWFVDAGVERSLIRPNVTLRLNKLGDAWTITGSDFSWAAEGRIVYAAKGIFRITSVSAEVSLVPLLEAESDEFYKKNSQRLDPGSWGYNTVVEKIEGLWWLEGETISVLADGDAIIDAVVFEGAITLPSESAYVVVGLGYNSDKASLPLSIPNYVLGGSVLTLRGLATRQVITRGLAYGTSFEDLEEEPSRTDEAWDNPLRMQGGLFVHELFGSGGWQLDKQVCMRQKYPLPCSIVGYTFELDVGD
jgi:hypothetical protein